MDFLLSFNCFFFLTARSIKLIRNGLRGAPDAAHSINKE